MPLEKGDNPEAIAHNIKEMQAHGHPHDVAIAAALHTAKDDQGEYGRAMSRFHRADDIHKVASQDAVLNWGGGQNANTVLPGGEGGTPTMPSGAATGTGVDAASKLSVGQVMELNYAGVPGFFKGQRVTIAEAVEQKWKLPGVKWAGVKGEKGITVRYRVVNEQGKSAWVEEGDLA